MSTTKVHAPPSRVPIAMYLESSTAKAQDIADALGMLEAEVLGVLGWHRQRGNVAVKGGTWRLTTDGRDWLRLYSETGRAPTRKAIVREVVEAKARAAVKAVKAKPLSAPTVRERLTLAGLWPLVESIAKEYGVMPMALVGPDRTQHLGHVRQALYAAIRSYPGRRLSGPEVAWLMGRHCHTTVFYGEAQHRARQRQQGNAA
jgi:hypothetical protein